MISKRNISDAKNEVLIRKAVYEVNRIKRQALLMSDRYDVEVLSAFTICRDVLDLIERSDAKLIDVWFQFIQWRSYKMTEEYYDIQATFDHSGFQNMWLENTDTALIHKKTGRQFSAFPMQYLFAEVTNYVSGKLAGRQSRRTQEDIKGFLSHAIRVVQQSGKPVDTLKKEIMDYYHAGGRYLDRSSAVFMLMSMSRMEYEYWEHFGFFDEDVVGIVKQVVEDVLIPFNHEFFDDRKLYCNRVASEMSHDFKYMIEDQREELISKRYKKVNFAKIREQGQIRTNISF